MSRVDAITATAGRPAGAPPAGAASPLPPVVVARRHAGVVPPRPRARLPNDPINWWLIGLAVIYLVWSYVAIGSSIWARFVLVVYLTLRMKPDVVIPYLLLSLQLRLSVVGVMGDEVRIDEGISGLTGFESYAFALPSVVVTARTMLAFFSARTDRRSFPTLLYAAWLAGLVIVLVGVFVNFRSGRGWTGALRIYAIVGMVFYGLLMPRLKPVQLDRLAWGVMVVTALIFAAALTGRFGSRLIFVLGPYAAAWGAGAALAFSSRMPAAVGILLLTSAVSVYRATLMAFGGWLWGAIAGVLMWTRSSRGDRSALRLQGFVASTAVFSLLLFIAGIQRQTSDKTTHDGSFLGRVEWKLYADRGPIWKGCWRIITEEPSILPTPERGFVINWFGHEEFWENGPHNLFLEVMNQLGWVAGPITMLVMAYVVTASTRVMARDRCLGAMMLAAGAVCTILVGGLTLPYVVQERQGEFVLISAGLAIGSSCVNLLEASGVQRRRA